MRSFNHSEKYLHFDGNHAAKGSILYGGQLDTCSMIPGMNNSLGIFDFITIAVPDNDTHIITSEITAICFCDEHSSAHCILREMNITRYRRQQITM